MSKKNLFIIFILYFFLFSLFSLDIPYLSGRVNDYTNTLDDNTITLLENKLANYEEKTTNQIAVLIIQSLEGENLNEFSIKTAERWKLGQKGKDNGVLLLVALNDRKLRIEVGYGLEEYLTDLKCGRIIRNKITPYFKTNNYDQGIIEGVDSIIKVIEGADNLDEQNTKTKNNQVNFIDSQVDDLDIVMRILMGFFIFGIIGLFTFIGIVAPRGFAGWFLYFFLIPFWAMFPIVIVGTKITLYILVIYLIGFPVAKIFMKTCGKNIPWLNKLNKSFRTSGRNSGFSSSSSSSSFSSSSSGFSGGGGSFGGGGASGSW